MKNSGALLWRKAKTIIPGGNQLLSKRAEMFLPEGWPAYYKKAKGVTVWDLDGRRYTDMSIMGIGSCVLGYANPAVTRAVKKAVTDGSMSTLNCPEEVELAERLIALHPWSGMVRFARGGGEACAMAVRIGRAASGKDKVLFCGYHGWADWYLAANLADSKNLDGQLLPGLEPAGIPRALKGTAYPFAYGDMDGFRKKVDEHGDETGVIIMEVQRSKDLDLPFLNEVRRVAKAKGIVLVYDEVTSGFRFCAGGMHRLHGLEPDMVVLGKALGNGHPISAVIGKKEVMQAAQRSFVSSTYWTERVGYAAALEVIRQYESLKVEKHLQKIGSAVREGLTDIFKKNQLSILVGGLLPVPSMAIAEKEPLVVKTLFTQLMLKRNYLASTLIFTSLAHDLGTVERYLKDAGQVWSLIAKYIRDGENLSGKLEGPVCHGGFQRLA